MFDIDNMGPVDVAILGFEAGADRSQVAAAVLDLVDGGAVRILDLAWVSKTSAGDVELLSLVDAGLADAFASIGEDSALLNEDDLLDVGDELEPGTAALLVVWENTWAAELATAVRAAKGYVIGFERIPREVVVAAAEALNELVEGQS
jgi:hypothetical protein